jgi:Mg2+ and Co2+ transporter CorA
MLNVFMADRRGCLTKIEVASDGSLPVEAVWLDLLAPTSEEERQVEAMLGVGVPTREEMQEIEVSSRLYEENGALYMTATVVARADTEHPEASAISFILAGDRLVTVRYAEPQSFALFTTRCQRSPGPFTRGDAVLAGLLDALIDRIADVIEHIGLEVDGISHEVFEHPTTPRKSGDFQGILRSLGRRGDLTSKVRESLVGIGRLLMFLGQAGTTNTKTAKDLHPSAHHDPRRALAHRARLLPVRQDQLPAGRHARHDQHRAERDHLDLLGGRGGGPAADPDRQHLRHEFHVHARAGVAARLSCGDRAHARLGARAALVLQAPRVALSADLDVRARIWRATPHRHRGRVTLRARLGLRTDHQDPSGPASHRRVAPF